MVSMSEEERQKLISPHLRLKPTLHGLINVSQLRVSPLVPALSLSPVQRQRIQESLQQYESNLVSLIIRPIQDDNVDYDVYEVIYGEEIYQVAKDIDHRQLWAWAFQLDDQAALKLRSWMQETASQTSPAPDTNKTRDPDTHFQVQDPNLVDQSSEIAELKSKVEHQEQELQNLKNWTTTLNGNFEKMSGSLEKIATLLEQGIPYSDHQKPNINTASVDGIAAGLPKTARQHAKRFHEYIQSEQGLTSIDQLKIKFNRIKPETIDFLKISFSCTPLIPSDTAWIPPSPP